MINKINKIIHNKYSKFFEFIFFLRYLLIIFIVSITLFLTIPIFFDYEKKAEVMKLYLLENYNFRISNYTKIKYNIFPLPNIEVNNVLINLKSSKENLSIKTIKMYPNFLSIYNYENFNLNKITLKDSNIKFQISNFGFISKQLFNIKKKIYFDNLSFEIFNENFPVISLKDIKFTNYGHKKNLMKGKVFGKNFKIEKDDDHSDINFELIDSGISANINFKENKKNDLKIGTFKSKILNTNFKSNFEYNGEVIKIFNTFLRSKSLSLKNKSEITLKPFLATKTDFIIEEFDPNILRIKDFAKILEFKELISKINNKSEIKFKPKKINRKFFNDFDLNINLAYGRMNYSKKLLIKNDTVECEGSINFLEENPLLFFDCLIKSNDKKKFLKNFSIKTQNKNQTFELRVKGNLSILNKKVNFKNISMDSNYEASREDLKYFKKNFETILFDKSFLEIFNLKKIKKFIIEIS